MKKKSAVCSLIGLALGAALLLGAGAMAEPAPVSVGLIAPMSGIYARYGQVMRMGAEMGIKDVNDQGGIKALGGAKLKLVIVDSGDTLKQGIGCMTDERQKSFYDMLVGLKIIDSSIDYKAAYTTQFVCKGVGTDLVKK